MLPRMLLEIVSRQTGVESNQARKRVNVGRGIRLSRRVDEGTVCFMFWHNSVSGFPFPCLDTDYAKYNDFAFFGDSAICFQNSGIAKLKTPILPDLASPLR